MAYKESLNFILGYRKFAQEIASNLECFGGLHGGGGASRKFITCIWIAMVRDVLNKS